MSKLQPLNNMHHLKQAALNEAMQWLWLNPPTGKNRAERRTRMALLQQACDNFAPSEFKQYSDAWKSDDMDLADALEGKHAAIAYLRATTLRAIDDIRATRVKRGLAVWHIYNMGHVFKTPTATFGIDLCGRCLERLAPDLDFLLTTHEHIDHHNETLLKSMAQLYKPVITRWHPDTTILSRSSRMVLNGIDISVQIGDHHYKNPDSRENMLMFEIACGREALNAVIYHSGDNSNLEKMRPTRPLDILIFHVAVGLPVAETITTLDAKCSFVSHLLELGHSPVPPKAWRWSFDYAFNKVATIPPEKTAILTWGERWLLPGTKLALA